MTNVNLPFLAEGVTKAGVSYWYKSEGDPVKEGENLVELVTDKATFNMPAPVTGTVKRILVREGSQAKVGELIAVIE
jgi:pyruvate/2-oxoglutarate dehydrogenase complex dihydrolipoamide acyltransferase (E2) component